MDEHKPQKVCTLLLYSYNNSSNVLNALIFPSLMDKKMVEIDYGSFSQCWIQERLNLLR